MPDGIVRGFRKIGEWEVKEAKKVGGFIKKEAPKVKAFIEKEAPKVKEFIKREAPVVQRAIRKGILTSGELTTQGIVYIEKDKLKKLEAIQAKRPLTTSETREMETTKGRIVKLEKVISKAKEKLEKFKAEEGETEVETYTEQPPTMIQEVIVNYPEIEARSEKRLEEVV
jgi:hypothetical protein